MRQTEQLGRERRRSLPEQSNAKEAGAKGREMSRRGEAGHDANMVAAAPLGSPRIAPHNAAVNPALVVL